MGFEVIYAGFERVFASDASGTVDPYPQLPDDLIDIRRAHLWQDVFTIPEQAAKAFQCQGDLILNRSVVDGPDVHEVPNFSWATDVAVWHTLMDDVATQLDAARVLLPDPTLNRLSAYGTPYIPIVGLSATTLSKIRNVHARCDFGSVICYRQGASLATWQTNVTAAYAAATAAIVNFKKPLYALVDTDKLVTPWTYHSTADWDVMVGFLKATGFDGMIFWGGFDEASGFTRKLWNATIQTMLETAKSHQQLERARR